MKPSALWIIIALCWAYASHAQEAPAVEELLQRFDQLYESTGTHARLEIEIVRPNKTRTMRLQLWSKGPDKALIVVEAPVRDAGTATLKVDNNLWNYLPKIDRTIRVPPSLMMGAWMGSDLSNDDLVKESSYMEDYTATLKGAVLDPAGWQVDLAAKEGVAGLWQRIEVVFSQDRQLPVLSRYYDRKGRLARTMRLGQVEQIGGRLVPLEISIEPAREQGQRTLLRYVHIEFDIELDESLFSLAHLERRR
jgi:outer membrane lipoprotein-sorting protein